MKIIRNIPNHVRREAVAFFKVLSPVLFIFLVSIYYGEFIIHAIKANVIINLGIIGAALYGVLLIMLRLLGAMADFRVIDRFGREARGGQPMKTLLSQPWLQARYVRHYLQHIANTGGTLASQLDQNAIENELHALQDEYNNRLELPQFFVGFMIAMGLLGTFIGLLETLTGISGMLDGMGGSGADVDKQFMKLVEELRKPLAGMGIAFSASMFGLVTSLVLAIMMINLRRYIGRVISLARNVMHDLTVMATHGAPVASARAEETVSTPVSAVSSTMLVGRFDLLSKKMEAVLGAFEENIRSTQRMVDLLGFGPRMKETSEKTLEELKMISVKNGELSKSLHRLIEVSGDSVKIGQTLAEIQKGSKDAGEASVLALKGVISAINEQQQISKQLIDVESGIARTASDLYAAQKQNAEFRDILLAGMKTMIDVQADQKRLMQGVNDVGSSILHRLDDAFEAQAHGHVEMGGAVANVNTNLGKIEEVNISGSRHLWDIKEKLTKLSNTMGIVDMIATGVSGQNALLETLVEEARLARHEEKQEENQAEQVEIPGVSPDSPPDPAV